MGRVAHADPDRRARGEVAASDGQLGHVAQVGGRRHLHRRCGPRRGLLVEGEGGVRGPQRVEALAGSGGGDEHAARSAARRPAVDVALVGGDHLPDADVDRERTVGARLGRLGVRVHQRAAAGERGLRAALQDLHARRAAVPEVSTVDPDDLPVDQVGGRTRGDRGRGSSGAAASKVIGVVTLPSSGSEPENTVVAKTQLPAIRQSAVPRPSVWMTARPGAHRWPSRRWPARGGVAPVIRSQSASARGADAALQRETCRRAVRSR